MKTDLRQLLLVVLILFEEVVDFLVVDFEASRLRLNHVEEVDSKICKVLPKNVLVTFFFYNESY